MIGAGATREPLVTTDVRISVTTPTAMNASPTDAFTFHRNVIVASKNPKHGVDCENGGRVYCAI
ncbi:hypothetical protein E4U17_006591 [Claviceps sp. LM77 group G4]|nr:hypothetical protein E4U17_006591 [Claviceps sp. LM77 group G4]